MLLVDRRDGSKELVAPLSALGLDVEELTLPSADIAFTGRGEGGTPVQVGIEFKKLSELVGALRSDRLAGHQLIEMQAFDFRWLLIEGELLFDVKSGALLEWEHKRHKRPTLVPMRGGISIGELMKRVLVLHLRGGLNPVWAKDRAMTLKWIEMLYRTWTDKDLDQHDSHLAIYQPPLLYPVSQMRRTMNSLPDIGFKVSKAIEDAFGTIRRAVNASAAEWAEVLVKDAKGGVKKFGMKRAIQLQDIFDGH